MRKKIILLLIFVILIPLFFIVLRSSKNENNIIYYHPLDNMPIIEGTICPASYCLAPKENRESKYIRFLSASVKIKIDNISGSGTICYYDSAKNEAWIISCGHLWSGNMSAKEGKNKNLKATIITWYHNEIKLTVPEEYEANVIFYNNKNGYDISLLVFKPNWKPHYFPIATEDYDIRVGDIYHSLGCDGAKEVARYETEIFTVGTVGINTKTIKNSPRPGRSGGGLLTDDGYYIGICVATTDTETGNGVGIFTSLPTIRYMFKSEGYENLLNITLVKARELPIKDRNKPERKFPFDYIPLPIN